MKTQTIILILTFITLISYHSGAYSANVNDSLENVLTNTKTDTAKARILNILAWNYSAIDSKKAWIYAKKALSLAGKHHLLLEEGAAYNNIGALHYYVKSLDSALIYYQKAKIAFQKAGNKKRVSRCLQNIAVVYNDKSDYKTAINIYQKLLINYLETKDSSQAANIYNNVGNSYNLMGNYDKAMENFLKAIEFYEKIGAKNNLSSVLYNMGALHFYKGSYDKAMEYCDQSLKLREEIKNPYGIAYSYLLKGVIFEAEKKYDEALEANNKALKIDEELGDKQGIASILLNISTCYINQNKLTEARKYSLDALRIIKETGIIKLQLNIYNNIGDIELRLKNYKAAVTHFLQTASLADSTGDKPELKDAYKGLATAYSFMGEYKNAFMYLQKHMDIKDTLFNAEKNRQLTEMDTKYQSVKKEKEIQLLNKDKALQKAEIEKKGEQVKRQRFIIISAIGGLVIVLIFTFFLFRLYSQKKKMNFMLANQNEEILQKNEEITAQRDEIEAQRDEITKQHNLVTIQKDKIEKIHKEVTDSINYAKRIQRATLPKLDLLKNHISEYFLIFKPRDIVSGDFYWVAEVEKQLIITVADCTGHGVPGAFMSMLGMSILKEIVIKEYITHPALILKRMRKEIINALQQKGVEGDASVSLSVKDGMDMALVSIDTETLNMQFAGANNPVYIVRKLIKPESKKVENEKLNEANFETLKTSELYELKGDKMPIAIHEHMEAFSIKEFQLQKGDCFYLMSDGFEDQFGGINNKKFKSKKLKEKLLAVNSLPLTEQFNSLNNTFEDWIGDYEQTDDVTLLGFKI